MKNKYNYNDVNAKSTFQPMKEFHSHVKSIPASDMARLNWVLIYYDVLSRDATFLILPEGVGFKVGGDTAIHYMVLQVYYAHIL